MVDSEVNSSDKAIAFFRSTVASAPHSSMAAKAFNSLQAYLSSCNVTLGDDPAGVIGEWLVHLKISGVSHNTAVAYFEAISGLYTKAVAAGAAPATEALRAMKARLVEAGGAIWRVGPDADALKRLKSITVLASGYPPGKNNLAADLILFSLLNGCMPLAQVARLTVKSLPSLEEESREVAMRNIESRRKFIFSLHQSERTPRQLTAEVERIVTDFLATRFIPMFGSADTTLRAYWTLAALACGISARRVLGMLGAVPAGLPVLSLVSPAETSAADAEALMTSVGHAFVTGPMKWFVMRLRPRVTYEEIDSRFASLSEVMKRPETFYPCDEIRRRIGKKRVKENRPVIPDIVFFKCREQDVFPMFCRIGDLAWCYTVSGRPGDAYASVPRRSFEKFQETIGHFTPEYTVAPLGGIPIREGDNVVIIGGDFREHTARVDKICPADPDGRTIYRLRLSDTGFEWTVHTDPRLLRPAPVA